MKNKNKIFPDKKSAKRTSFANFFNACLNREQLDSHTCFWIQSAAICFWLKYMNKRNAYVIGKRRGILVDFSHDCGKSLILYKTQ